MQNQISSVYEANLRNQAQYDKYIEKKGKT